MVVACFNTRNESEGPCPKGRSAPIIRGNRNAAHPSPLAADFRLRLTVTVPFKHFRAMGQGVTNLASGTLLYCEREGVSRALDRNECGVPDPQECGGSCLYGSVTCEARALLMFKQKHTTLRITRLLKGQFQFGNPCGPTLPAHNSECCELGVPALRTKIVVVWVMAQSTSTGIYQRFGRTCCQYLQGRTTPCYNAVNNRRLKP